MQRAEIILSLLSRKARNDENFVFRRLYRHLFNPDFYLNAYHSIIHSKPENNMVGVNGKTIDGLKPAVVNAIIDRMKTETYHPQPVWQSGIPKKNGGQNRMAVPTFEDRLVQEVLRSILEAIYEPCFLDTSHGFRPDRSCQTALHAIKASCRGSNWIIEGHLQRFFDTVNHDKLMELLFRRIDDGRFLELIHRFLRAGYFQLGRVYTYSTVTGTPQGGVLSSLLANIYLHELDKFMQDLSSPYTEREIKKRNREHRRPKDGGCTRVGYTRYADHFMVGIIGSKQMARTIREDIRTFLKDSLNLEWNPEKSRITNLAEKRARFLGYEITRSISRSQLIGSSPGVKKRRALETIQLLVPGDVIREQIRSFSKNGKPIHHKARIHRSVPDLIRQYNAEIRGLYDYYRLATDVSAKLGKFRYFHYYSLVKTIARKEKSSVKKVLDKYGMDVKRKQGTGTKKLLGVTIQSKDGKKKVLTYFNEPLQKKDDPITVGVSKRYDLRRE
ncbi:reverse transcriptase domain-containing protein [Paludifilum halophilum]|nr:reverse transcriptase domain-containing protein [Paludifilum halophilum]